MAWIERCLFEENIIHSEEKSLKPSLFERWKWMMIGLAVLILGISILECKQPYYFVQDDNFAQFLPIILEGCRALMKGAILDWSPYQFLGFPIASAGEYVLTYPPTYLSYGIARYLLGNELFTLDVFCILHLIVGYFVTYLLLRRNKLHPSLAAAGSLSFILSGYTLIAGRSWFTMIASVVWIPLLFLSVIILQQSKPTWKWIIGTGCVLGIFYHAGHAQIWGYAVIFFLFSIAILFCLGKLPLYKVLYVIPAFLFGLAIVMPLLIPQWSIVKDVPRYPLGAGIPYKGILAMLLPFPLVGVPHPEIGWGTAYDQKHMTPFYYSGTLFSAVFFGTILAILVLLLFQRNKWLLLKRFMADNVWIISALFAFMLALGNRGLLWGIQSKLPLFNKFRMPFKFLHYVNLFTVMGSGVIIERCLCLARNKRFWRPFLGVTVCSLMLYHVNLSTASFYSYGDRPIHSRLPKEMSDIIGSPAHSNAWRVLSLSAERSPKTGYIFSFNHNFPSIFGVFVFGGYDPFIDKSPYFTKAKQNLFSRPLEAAHAYDVRWVIVDEKIEEGELIDARTLELANFFLAHGVRRLRVSDYTLLEFNNTQPAAFVEGNPQEAMPIYIRNNGIDIDVSRISTTGGRLVINMLWRPEVMILNGKEKLPCVTDSWGRVVTEVPPHAQIVKFRYIPPWKAGFVEGILCLFCAMLTYLFIKNKNSINDSIEK